MQMQKETRKGTQVCKGKTQNSTCPNMIRLVRDECQITDLVIWAWSESYKEKIKKALRAVEREHGDDGLTIAWWAVRNRVRLFSLETIFRLRKL